MSWKNIFVNYKPEIGCLVTHQLAWEDLETKSNRDSKFCSVCQKYFYYPTKQKEPPIYR